MKPEWGNLPFKIAIAFFRQKLNVPTEQWEDMIGEMHDTGFMVAGAMETDMLDDFKEAIDSAISDGTSLAQFRKSFDDIVDRYGWTYKGSRGWRTGVIYNTNVRTAYAAGRYRQMDENRKRRPYWEYRHGGSRNPRKEHKAWHGLILPADDPWWKTHYPPNGWGCT